MSEVYEVIANPRTMSRFWFGRQDDGLRKGEAVTWTLGEEPDAPSFEVRIIAVDRPHSIVMEWGSGEDCTTVTWRFEDKDRETTVLRVKETGFSGEWQEVVSRALDSTGGFNQVVVAAKALLEHGAVINVVKDHAMP